ncbi:hypothetical protein SH668x_000986 [Planctomicrobium sp. SH668]|uniref:hypothetical protein n=1 Tax=Planctomicrobium sp. SH668 TaxID=3448126 RepID=UPI003F5B1BBB
MKLLVNSSLSAVLFGMLLIPTNAWAQKNEKKAKSVPTIADIAYDEHPSCRIDFWKAEGEGPRPLLIHIHGGDGLLAPKR